MKRSVIVILLLVLITSCKPKTYTVTFEDAGEKLLSVEVKKGGYLGDVENPIKDGYIFLSWLKDGFEYNINNPINEDIILEASWTEVPHPVKTYTVSFNYESGIKTVSVKENELVTMPKETPKKDKHTFLGWYENDTLYDFDTPVTKDIVLTPRFEKTRINIHYNLEGGSGTVEVEIDKGSIPNRPVTPTKFGYTFIKWQINDEDYNFDKPLYEDTTIKAIYEANVYVRVSYDSDGGEEIISEMLIQGDKLDELPVPMKEGYTFLYWTYHDEEFKLDTPINEDITLIAKYKKNES